MSQSQVSCMECSSQIKHPIYAIYNGEEVVGHVCEACWARHKMKPLREKSPFAKLAKLKEQMEK